MITGNKIPFVNENLKMKKALQIISNKKLGTLVVQNNKKLQQELLQMVKLEDLVGQVIICKI